MPKVKRSHTETTRKGSYANFFKIGHNAFEFVFDFEQYNFESEEAELCTRIYTGPAHAKALLGILQKSVNEFEDKFGIIDGDL